MEAQQRQSILIVEDDADVRALMVEVLRQSGYQTVAVADAETALQHLTVGTFGMVLTDYHLPDLSGGKLIRQISKTWPQTRTLLMSAHPLVTQLAQECGADAVFRKGEPVVQLLACIARLVPTTITPGCCAS